MPTPRPSSEWMPTTNPSVITVMEQVPPAVPVKPVSSLLSAAGTSVSTGVPASSMTGKRSSELPFESRCHCHVSFS